MTNPDGLLIDLDGTVYQGDHLIPGSAAAIARLRDLGVPHLFSTNTSRKSRADVVNALSGMGLAIEVEQIYTAPISTSEWLAARGLRRVHALLDEATWVDLEDVEFTRHEADVVVVGDLGREFTFDTLNYAFRSLLNGARLVAVHKNRFWLPAEEPVLDAGPFVAALEYAAATEAVLVGKPAPEFFLAAAARLSIEPESLAVVGDDLSSDVLGGNRVGMTTVLVQTGKYDEAALGGTAPDTRPDHVVADLAAAVHLLV